MSYTKLFSSIVTSTIWTEDATTCKVWVTMLAIANKHGEVLASIPGLAQIAGLGLNETESAIERFLSPDKYSRTPDDEGRRIERIEGGWMLLNHAKYRAMASKDEEKAANAKRQAAFRDRRNRNAEVTESNDCVTVGNDPVTSSRDIAEAEADTKADTDTKPPSLSLSKEEGSGRAREITPIEEIQKRINEIKPEWGKPAHWSCSEQHSLHGGTATQIGELTDADWQMLKLYMNSFMPEGGAYWQPRSRSKFVDTFADTFGSAVRWANKTGNAPKQPQTKKDGWK